MAGNTAMAVNDLNTVKTRIFHSSFEANGADHTRL
jgi:hypothetical protein